MESSPIIWYLLIGSCSGFLSGLLGIGGGVVVVPGLLIVFTHLGYPSHVIMHMAAGTSLASIVFTSMASAQTYHQARCVDWPTVYRFLPGIIIGTIVGAKIANNLPTAVLSILFGAFLIFIAIRMFMLVKPKPGRSIPNQWIINSLAFLVGAKSGLLGIGGGALMVPFYTRCNMPMRTASGTSVSCSVFIALVGSITLMFWGCAGEGLPPLSTGCVFWPAALAVAVASILLVPIGALAAQKLSTDFLKRIFALFLVVAAVRMFMANM